MPNFKRMVLTVMTGALFIGGTTSVFAQSSAQDLQNIQQDLNQKAQEKQAVSNEISSIQQEMNSLNTYISQNQAAMAETQKRMAAANQLIEEKKAEIVNLEDTILSRKDVMKKRLVALQHDNNLTLAIKVFLDSKSLNDFIQRASAVTALFSADKNILDAQQADLKKIENDKKEIDRQQQTLVEEQKTLAQQQAELSQNLQKRQDALTAMQAKYNQIDQQMALAEQQKASIQAELKAAQDRIRQEQQAAKQRAAQAVAAMPVQASAPAPVQQAANGQELYVTATAYSPEESGAITTLGYNIKANPNMKLIAVDPSVIPLGKKVWVEGYGIAIAGDTGGAIVGHKIDVLMPTRAASLIWGRKTVKVVVLN
ncbi:3D domain-containing protein [Neobacillus sp. SM06]|uniref:3D domain-containing protein n=1 Tax=Neobacillus sp. SM06 TaxID=3422492 RepID=UPI003D2D28E4